MDITDNVNNIVQGIVTQITSQVQQQAMAAIQQKIDEVVKSIDGTSLMTTVLNQKLDAKLSQLPINATSIEAQLLTQVNSLASNLAQTVQYQAIAAATESVNAQIDKIDFAQLCQATLLNALQQQTLKFPNASIPGSAIDQSTVNLSGNSVNGGIIQNFGSTGIDDKATSCQLSIFDEVTVVENNLVTRDLTVKGTTTIEGDLNVTGTLPESSTLFQNVVRATSERVTTNLNQGIFQGYANLVTAQLQSTGIDLSKITVQGQEIINGNSIGNFITQSNLQKVGQLSELQVAGEAFLSATLYTTNGRVGINTIEPGCALSIWDQEVEVTVSKQTSNTAIIETPRNQSLVLSSNGQDNITLTPDGATTVNKIINKNTSRIEILPGGILF